MRICLNLDPSRLFSWHLWLRDALAEVPGTEVSCAFSAGQRPLPLSCRLLLELERLVYGLDGGATGSSGMALRSLPPCPTDEVDVVVDFSGEESLPASRRVLTPLFNGVPAEIGVILALTNDEDLLVNVHDSARPSLPWTARPASLDRGVFAAGLDSALSCVVALILKALRQDPPTPISGFPLPRAIVHPRPTPFVLASAARTTASKAAKFLDILARGGKTWGIGWRFDDSSSLLDEGQATYRILVSDGSSYLADPFPFRHQAQDFIFVEQYSYAKGRGCIAVVAVNRDGTAGSPQIVLEEPHHLSYPFVFEQDGQIWMIPESGGAKNVSLYRAVEFPHRWTREACLIGGVEGYDTTLLHHQSGLWFFVSPKLWKSTSWDALNLYRAESLTGPLAPHAANPVLIDATVSRPAGAFIQIGSHTLRPVQDCARSYGSAITIYKIDALSLSEFAQTPVGRISAGTFGCHTYNRRAGLEVIDLFGRIRNLREVTASFRPVVPRGALRPS